MDLQIRQEESNLVLWFRNPMTPARSQLAWYIPGVFAAGQTRNILVSYDGADAKVFLDGLEYPRVYRLGPGTGFAHLFRMELSRANWMAITTFIILWFSSRSAFFWGSYCLAR